jgi:hypothetical protein
MDALITGETERIGLSVIDNNNVEHLIEMKKYGDIKHHEQNGYSDDPSKRTDEGNEHVEQARKFAQYYVYHERGYDTVEPENHPERINAVRLALQNLSEERAEILFGDLYQQLLSHYDPDVSRAIPIPRGAPSPEAVVYRQHVYLGIDPLESDIAAESRELATTHDVDFSEITETPVTEMSDEDVSRWESFTDDLKDLIGDTGADLSDSLYVDAVSSVYAGYVDGAQFEIGEPDTDPFDREPDAIIELPPVESEPFSRFRKYLDHHLKCQVRDTFVRMGVEPPEEFRVVGNGRLPALVAYKFLDMYPKYYDPEELDSF